MSGKNEFDNKKKCFSIYVMVRQEFFYLTKSLRETRKSKKQFQTRTFWLKFLQSPSSLDIMASYKT